MELLDLAADQLGGTQQAARFSEQPADLTEGQISQILGGGLMTAVVHLHINLQTTVRRQFQ